MELKMIVVYCRCGLSFKVNEGNKQVWHSAFCRDFYEDKDRLDASRSWRRQNGVLNRDSKNNKKDTARR
jgi:hypothetical protein